MTIPNGTRVRYVPISEHGIYNENSETLDGRVDPGDLIVVSSYRNMKGTMYYVVFSEEWRRCRWGHSGYGYGDNKIFGHRFLRTFEVEPADVKLLIETLPEYEGVFE